jgi:hypothetical protein
MLPEAISDQKRLVRGEHWLRARHFLRARDHAHHRAWRLLTIAGPSPAEEINSIRAVMPKAHITAVDIDESNVMSAIDAGADEAHVCDLGQIEKIKNATGFHTKTLPPPILRDQKFDVVSLDLTGPANDWLASVVGCYFNQALLTKGVMSVTFSYGRDVVEAQACEWTRMQNKAAERYEWQNGTSGIINRGYADALEMLRGVPEYIAIRIWYALRTRCNELDSCIQYRGHKMPMVSCLLAKNHPLEMPVKFAALSEDDLRFALVNEELNLSMLYACPLERIKAFRSAATRKAAARKAVETRKLKAAKVPPVPLLTYEHGDGREQQD